MFPKFAGEEFENFTALAEKLRSDYDFGHTLDAKLLPRGEPVEKPTLRLLKPFDELFVDFQVLQDCIFPSLFLQPSVFFWTLPFGFSLYLFGLSYLYSVTSLLLQDFQVAAMEKFLKEASIPTVTIFDNNPINHPYVHKFFDNPNAKVPRSFVYCTGDPYALQHLCCEKWR